MTMLMVCLILILSDDWDGTLGNPGKLGLGIISILYNCIFLIQHFIIYQGAGSSRVAGSGRKRALSDRPDKDIFHENFLVKLDRKLAQVKASLFPSSYTLIHRVQDI